MKNYLLGQNAADFLKGQMADQTAVPGDTVQKKRRLSGDCMPFKITGGWTRANGETAYSCKAKQVYWDGAKYVMDNIPDAFEFTLYSPTKLDELPDNAVGDVVFAVVRGNHWEIIGGGGGGASAPSIPCRFGMTLVEFNAGTVGNVRLYDNFAMTSYTTVKAFVPPNFYQVAVAANTPCELLPTEYVVGSETIKWMIGPILYSSPETTP